LGYIGRPCIKIKEKKEKESKKERNMEINEVVPTNFWTL
jgi:hypothetical protein